MLKRLAAGFFFITAFLLFPRAAFASTLYLTPAGGSIGVGATQAVQVRLNAGGDAVNAVSAYLSYPADKLDISYINYGSAFSIAAEGSYGGGSIRIARGSISPVSGNVLVATIGFRGKSLGTASVSFVGGSAAPRASDSSESLNLGASRGGTFNVVTAPPKPAAASALNISDVRISDIATNSATISWKTDQQSDSTVNYGLEQDRYFLSANKADLVTEHSIKLNDLVLLPGTKLHLRIRSKDAGGNIGESQDQTVQLKGYIVSLKIVNSKNEPLKGTDVFLYSDPLQGKTDDKGQIQFNNVTPGKHLVLIKKDLLERSLEIEVKNDNNFDAAQTFSLKADLQPSLNFPNGQGTIFGVKTVYVILAAALLLLLIAAAAVVLAKKKFKSSPSSPQNNTPPPESSLFTTPPQNTPQMKVFTAREDKKTDAI